MYFNDIHILIYLAVGLVGCIVGQIIGLVNSRLMNNEKIFEKGSLKKFKIECVPHYRLMILMFVLYIVLLYACGIEKNWHSNIRIVSYFLLLPLLICAFKIDLKKQIIPNRLVLTIFELGLIVTFFEGIVSQAGVTFALNRLEGMVCGALVFLAITLLGGLFAGKEAMGMGDVKLMGAIGLFFGMRGILIISVIAFVIGAVASIFLLVSKKKKADEYIPFGPFIVIASVIAMLIPEEILFQTLWFFFSGQWFLKRLYK